MTWCHDNIVDYVAEKYFDLENVCGSNRQYTNLSYIILSQAGPWQILIKEWIHSLALSSRRQTHPAQWQPCIDGIHAFALKNTCCLCMEIFSMITTKHVSWQGPLLLTWFNFNPSIPLYNGCDYLSMLGLKLNHVSKRGPRCNHPPFWAEPRFNK